ncbi:hypothetical protein Tco_0591580 [Tanacetum coccineum]
MICSEERKKKLARKSSISVSVPDNRYAVSNGSGYAVLISWIEYAVFDREVDTPYPVEVDMPYSTVDQNSGLKQWSGSRLDTAYPCIGYGVLGFLGVRTTFDIFQNIILIPYLEYGVLSPLDTVY